MFLPAEGILLLVAGLWLPVLALLGAGQTVLAWALARRQGPAAVVWACLGTTALGAAAVMGVLGVQTVRWGGRLGARDGAVVALGAALLLGVCLGAAALASRRRGGGAGALTAAGVAGGAAAASGAWLACAAVALLAVRLAR